MHIYRYEEVYLIPIPNVKVKGILSGTPYLELTGQYSIVSSTGFMSKVKFEGEGLVTGGTKNRFQRRVFNVEKPPEHVYIAKAQWSNTFSVLDSRTREEIEIYDAEAESATPISAASLSEQDPWELIKAWRWCYRCSDEG